MLEIKLTPKKNWGEFVKKVRLWPNKRSRLISRILSMSADEVITTSQTKYLTGARKRGFLNVDTGRLRSSLTKHPKSGAVKRGNSYFVIVGTNVWYGRMYHEGFMNRKVDDIIRPKKAKALMIPLRGGRVIFRKSVKVDSRPRPFLSNALDDVKPNMVRVLMKAGVQFDDSKF